MASVPIGYGIAGAAPRDTTGGPRRRTGKIARQKQRKTRSQRSAFWLDWMPIFLLGASMAIAGVLSLISALSTGPSPAQVPAASEASRIIVY